jgi:LPXTG-site transpeptidase (sortase) family protein
MTTALDGANRPSYGATSLGIEIPALNLATTIVGVNLQSGTWDVSWLQNQVGWLNGTAYPTWAGNSVLTAHSINTDGRPGIFYNLRGLRAGDFISVNNAGYRYTYKVVSNKSVQPNDISVLKHQEKSYLTLLTCDKYDMKSGTFLRRTVVSAVLVDVSAIK